MKKKQISSVTYGIPSIFLTSSEVQELTNFIHKKAQIRALRHMGIQHKVRPDGSVAVLRFHVECLLCGEVTDSLKKKIEPQWSSL